MCVVGESGRICYRAIPISRDGLPSINPLSGACVEVQVNEFVVQFALFECCVYAVAK